MNIAANTASLNVITSTPANRLATAGRDYAAVNLNVATAANVNLAQQTPTIENPTYDRPVNNQSSTTVSPDLVEPAVAEQQKEGSSNVQQQQGEEKSSKQTGKQVSQQQRGSENNGQYTETELAHISDLKYRDSEVQKHERAHSAVGGQYAGSPSYSYKTGPDGVKYAVSGEVSIDTSKVPNNPQATLQKAQQIKAAALAPSQPSAQDRSVAAKADQMASQARSEIVQENNGRNEENTSRSNVRYESSSTDHFTRTQYLANENDFSEQQLTNRIELISNVYHSSSSIEESSTFQTQV